LVIARQSPPGYFRVQFARFRPPPILEELNAQLTVLPALQHLDDAQRPISSRRFIGKRYRRESNAHLRKRNDDGDGGVAGSHGASSR
jgi:hypothetical protein